MIYAAVYAGDVFKSMNGGTTWVAVSPGLWGSTGPALTLAIDPTTPSTIYAGTGVYGVYRSTDSGNSWVKDGTPNLTELPQLAKIRTPKSRKSASP